MWMEHMIASCYFLAYGKMDKCLQDRAQPCSE